MTSCGSALLPHTASFQPACAVCGDLKAVWVSLKASFVGGKRKWGSYTARFGKACSSSTVWCVLVSVCTGMLRFLPRAYSGPFFPVCWGWGPAWFDVISYVCLT